MGITPHVYVFFAVYESGIMKFDIFIIILCKI